jgi:hypothetical protein
VIDWTLDYYRTDAYGLEEHVLVEGNAKIP